MRHLLLRLATVITIAGLGLAGTVAALLPAGHQLGDAGDSNETAIDLGPLDQRSYVYAADGSVLATLRAEIDRQPVPLSKVPRHVVDAVLAVEDADYYAHGGVNLRATLRALLTNVEEGGVSQGGSTITQQLVKQELLSDEQSLDRKAREAVLATRLEEQMTKDEILERYLNVVYFGNGAYGVQAAAETYFEMGVESLDIAQAALLAGLIANPSQFDPTRDAEAAQARRLLVLRRMATTGAISAEQVDELADAPLPSEASQVLPDAGDYFVEEVKQQLLDDPRLGATRDEREYAVFRGGLRIHTTLDPKAQLLATASRNDVLAEVAPDGAPPAIVPIPNPTASELEDKGMAAYTGPPREATGAVVSVEPSTGAVRAMVGGAGFDSDKYNVITQSPGRQTGSAFKVFVLMALLENGFVPDDSVSGSGPCKFDIPGLPEDYEVENFGNSRGGTRSILQQTLQSSNCAYVRLGQIVGLDKVVEQARQMGVTAALDASFFSLPLGSVEIRPIEMAAAFASIANDGIYHEPYLIDRVESRDGGVVIQHETDPRRASTRQSARLAVEILQNNVLSGTGTRARIPTQFAAGKTGTAQDSSNGWFVGFTPYLSTAVWIGEPDDNFGVRIGGIGITGGSYPAEIWGRYMRAWHESLPEVGYPAPASTRTGRFLRVDRDIDPRGFSTSDSDSSSRRRRRTSSRSSSSSSSDDDDSAATTTEAPAATEPPTTAAPTTTAPPGGGDGGDGGDGSDGGGGGGETDPGSGSAGGTAEPP